MDFDKSSLETLVLFLLAIAKASLGTRDPSTLKTAEKLPDLPAQKKHWTRKTFLIQ